MFFHSLPLVYVSARYGAVHWIPLKYTALNNSLFSTWLILRLVSAAYRGEFTCPLASFLCSRLKTTARSNRSAARSRSAVPFCVVVLVFQRKAGITQELAFLCFVLRSTTTTTILSCCQQRRNQYHSSSGEGQTTAREICTQLTEQSTNFAIRDSHTQSMNPSTSSGELKTAGVQHKWGRLNVLCFPVCFQFIFLSLSLLVVC